MKISIDIELSDIEHEAVLERSKQVGLSLEDWSKMVLLRRVTALSGMIQQRRNQAILDKFHASPDHIKKQLLGS